MELGVDKPWLTSRWSLHQFALRKRKEDLKISSTATWILVPENKYGHFVYRKQPILAKAWCNQWKLVRENKWRWALVTLLNNQKRFSKSEVRKTRKLWISFLIYLELQLRPRCPCAELSKTLWANCDGPSPFCHPPSFCSVHSENSTEVKVKWLHSITQKAIWFSSVMCLVFSFTTKQSPQLLHSILILVLLRLNFNKMKICSYKWVSTFYVFPCRGLVLQMFLFQAK